MIRHVKGIFFQKKKLWFTVSHFLFLQVERQGWRDVFIFASCLNSRAKAQPCPAGRFWCVQGLRLPVPGTGGRSGSGPKGPLPAELLSLEKLCPCSSHKGVTALYLLHREQESPEDFLFQKVLTVFSFSILNVLLSCASLGGGEYLWLT